MANITRNFTSGRMNKTVDERLVPNGEYIDALNCRLGGDGLSDVGTMINLKGNEKLSTLKYTDGTLLSGDAIGIRAVKDSKNNMIYWFVHDPSFTVGSTGKLDLIVSIDITTSFITYHVISIDDGGHNDTTLNFSPDHFINGVNLIDDMLFFTDFNNQPRKINVKRDYAVPLNNIDQFTEESILVIKKPPTEAPTIELLTTENKDNYLSDRMISFAYRYKYYDDEYSAISQFSEAAFVPENYSISRDSGLNEGMVNSANEVLITYNSGNELVKGIDLLFKESTSNIIKIIDKINKKDDSIVDNQPYNFRFNNSKALTILPESELLRLYDNVPLKAKAQTIMGNRIIYSNYVEGYDLVDLSGNDIDIIYTTEVVSEEINSVDTPTTKDSGYYTMGGGVDLWHPLGHVVDDCIVYIDLAGVDLIEGSVLSLNMNISHQGDFTGDGTHPTEETPATQISFSFVLRKDYASPYLLATSDEFKAAVGTAANIKTVANACSGTTLTDVFNCSIPNSLGVYEKISSGIDFSGEPIKILSSDTDTRIAFKLLSMRFLDSVTNKSIFEYYKVSAVTATFQNIQDSKSLHSNRGYEIGIVYMDDFNRSSTVLISRENTQHISCENSIYTNHIKVTIPPKMIAPYWATRYKFVIKEDKSGYDTIYTDLYFKDPETGATYFLLEGENLRKVETGDTLIVKRDSNGAIDKCVSVTVLDKELKESTEIAIDSEIFAGQTLPYPSGVYMKIKANDFTAIIDEQAFISADTITSPPISYNQYPKVLYPFSYGISGGFQDYTIKTGTRITLSFKFVRKGSGDGNNACERRIYTLEKTLVSSNNYDNFKDWWDGDYVEGILNDGVSELGSGGVEIGNIYTNPSTILTDVDATLQEYANNHYQFVRPVSGDYSGCLLLVVSGTVQCSDYSIGLNDKAKSSVSVDIKIFNNESVIIFETESQDTDQNIFYENHESYPIGLLGQHLTTKDGDTSQDFTLNTSAIIHTGFFNCFSYGNGAESYKIKDSIVGKGLVLGHRVATVSEEVYSAKHRYADMTYSGVYNNETNVNRLNAFNMGLENYKKLESSFGEVQVIDGRETDIIVIHEEKITYVLAGKNLLSDAAAGSVLTSVPEVLGTQIARLENYGISNNPESYVAHGYDRYFTDAKRGVVIQLKGGSYQNDALQIISDTGMKAWFRDLFNESFYTHKIGAFDPYTDQYILTSNSIVRNVEQECSSCGMIREYVFSFGNDIDYCVNIGTAVGVVTITYEVVDVDTTMRIDATYNNNVYSSGNVGQSGSFSFYNDIANEETVSVLLKSNGGTAKVIVKVGCATTETLNITEVCVNTSTDYAPTNIYNEFQYKQGQFTSVTTSEYIWLLNGTTDPIVSNFRALTGYKGYGSFPPDGATVRIISNKRAGASFVFDPNQMGFRYYATNFPIANTPQGIAQILDLSTPLNPSYLTQGIYYADFVMPSGAPYLYLVWDYRRSSAVQLAYSDVSGKDSCCGSDEYGLITEDGLNYFITEDGLGYIIPEV